MVSSGWWVWVWLTRDEKIWYGFGMVGTELSVAQRVALLPDDERERMLAGYDPALLLYNWEFWARPSQYLDPLDHSWYGALYMGGRGSGKTRGGCEWVRGKAMAMPGSRGALVGRTAADVRDVLIDGPSGIMAISPPSERPEYMPSKRRLEWPNGTVATLASSEVPDSLRGPAFDWAVGDEIATWSTVPDASGLTAFDNLRIATREGAQPQYVLMTTPKRTQFIKDLLSEAAESNGRFLLRRGRTMDNAGNLSAAYLHTITSLYDGTALAAQELGGELVGDVEGALWRATDLPQVGGVPDDMRGPVVLVGVDPSVAEDPRDECGIVVVVGETKGELGTRRIFVLEDYSLRGSPDAWAQQVVKAARKYGALVVAEVNQGGALVRSVVSHIDPLVKVHDVSAHVGKALRAEPVQLAAQRGRVALVGEFPELVDQMTSWVPSVDKKSPDRVDALVHACTPFLVPSKKLPLGGGGLSLQNPEKRRLALLRAGDGMGMRLPRASAARGLFGS